MKELNMKGPFLLTKEEIDKQIPEGVIGNYAYGYTKTGNDGETHFYVQYVGRSDENLRERAKHGIGSYKKFKFSVASTTKEAFEKECRNWHDFGGPEGTLANKIHPDKPQGTDYKCPICKKDENDDKKDPFIQRQSLVRTWRRGR